MHIIEPLKNKPIKTFLGMAVMLACLVIVVRQIAHVPVQDVWDAARYIKPQQWIIAFCATALSFWAIGQYDLLWHNHLRTGVTPETARRSGMAAVAIGQTVGMGVVTGTFVRWSMTQPQSLKTAGLVTFGVAASFFACWLLIALPAAVVIGYLDADFGLLATLVLLTVVLIAIALRRFGHATLGGHIPRLMILTAIDITCAGIALWTMIPNAGASILPTVIAAYTLALGAGLISNAPGGLGAFEVTLIFMLDQIPEPALIAGMLGFRLIYYVCPAGIAAIAFINAHRTMRHHAVQTTSAPISDLCHQGAKSTHAGHTIRRHLFGTVVLEPEDKSATPTNDKRGFIALYKAHPRVAAKARQEGWAVRHIADDAIIDLPSWSTSGPCRRQLRRKLTQAQSAGVIIRAPLNDLPLHDMQRVARQWRRNHGGELGYAMGRYAPEYVARQRVFLIYHDACLCGFVTVQARPQIWAVDLIRHVPQMPAGAMHLAIHAIISAAQEARATQLTLGAVPNGPRESRLQNRAAGHKAGLRQFKASFGPRWSPRYHAAPTRPQWILSVVLIFLHIQRPFARLPDYHWRSRGEFINFTRIIHLNRRRARVTDDSNKARTKAHVHDKPLFQTAG